MSSAIHEARLGAPLVRGNVPLYKQLKELLRDAILKNRIPVGQTLPTEKELIDAYGVSRVTVRQALQDLEAEGLIRRSRPKGNVVVDNRPQAGSGWSFESLQDIVVFAEQTKVRVLSFEDEEAPEEIGKIFGFSQPTMLPCVHGLRLLNGEPLSEYFFWLLPSVAHQLTRNDLTHRTLFPVIESRLGVRLVEADQTVWCEPATRGLAKLLRIRPSAPVLAIRRIYMAERRLPVEVAVSRFRGDRYRMHHVLTKR